ncbi:hypothetical protein [Streptomyces sp. NPDC090112]|uniref:hypothetical protein n=1 Tax=Streptomyces sp. NPDC090112 TaxID=3365949 RepID=UPI0037FBFE4F
MSHTALRSAGRLPHAETNCMAVSQDGAVRPEAARLSVAGDRPVFAASSSQYRT